MTERGNGSPSPLTIPMPREESGAGLPSPSCTGDRTVSILDDSAISPLTKDDHLNYIIPISDTAGPQPAS